MEEETLREVIRAVKGCAAYYRSKFSRDCSRGETEEEKSTEMIVLSDILSQLK